MANTLFHLGPVLITSPGPFNADSVSEDFGQDFAVKPLVGTLQDREAMGEADNHMTISGTLFPEFYARAGQDTGMSSVDLLRAMAKGGGPQPMTRGDGVNLGYWLVEKVSLKSSKLAPSGNGKVVTYDIQLVRTNRQPDPADLAEMVSLVMDSIVNLYG